MADSVSSTGMPTGATGAGGGNMLRITGLNTGLDIDAMVKKMLLGDQTKIDKAKQQQQLTKWKQEAYQSIISDIKDLQNSYFDITKSANCLTSSGNYNNMLATSVDPSVVNATATADATAGNYKILVSRLASSAKIEGSELNVSDQKATASTKLTDLGFESGKTYTYDISYGSNNKTTKVSLTISDNTTITDFTNAVNRDTNGAVTAGVNDLTGKFSIQASDTGESSKLTIKASSDTGETSADIWSHFGMTYDETENTGKNALFAIKEPNSSDYIGAENTSNNFTINGVKYNLSDVNSTASITKGESVTPNSGDSPVSISVAQDTSKMHDLISNFIDKYNNVVGEIQDKLNEKKDYDYQPLTDSQKSSMSAADISSWESKAKQGILRNDDNLQNFLDDLTSAFNAPVLDSDGKSVSTIYFGSYGDNALGIDTSSDVSQGSKISIVDDSKFEDAINNHTDEIMKLFTSTSASTDKTTKFNQSGIFQRISQVLNDNVGVIGSSYNTASLTKYANLQDDYTTTGSGGTGTLPDQIYQQQLIITNLTNRMNDDQTKYYNQFTQLETAMEQLNAQQSTISAYFS